MASKQQRGEASAASRPWFSRYRSKASPTGGKDITSTSAIANPTSQRAVRRQPNSDSTRPATSAAASEAGGMAKP